MPFRSQKMNRMDYSSGYRLEIWQQGARDWVGRYFGATEATKEIYEVKISELRAEGVKKQLCKNVPE